MNKKKLVILAVLGAVAGVIGYRVARFHSAEKNNKSDEQFKLRPGVPEIDPPIDWGFKHNFSIDKSKKVSVLITGANSYIGMSFEEYVKLHYPENFEIHTLDMQNPVWADSPLWDENIDTVFHVVGIAHADVGNATEAEIEKYYRINTDLALECARKAQESEVKQFIFMSSMIIYGGEERIDEHTIPAPSNFYGDSKWQADKGLRAMASASASSSTRLMSDKSESGEQENGNNGGMAVAVLRPPMIYGKGSRGNYPILSRIAKSIPVFPVVGNKRSMLYIENLCELLCGLVLSGQGGVYIPQNSSYSNTSELVEAIATVSRKKMVISRMLTPAVAIAMHTPLAKIKNLVSKAFGNSYYSQELSEYRGLEYQKYSLQESIRRTEG